MGALKPIFDWDTPSSYDWISILVEAHTLKNKKTILKLLAVYGSNWQKVAMEIHNQYHSTTFIPINQTFQIHHEWILQA